MNNSDVRELYSKLPSWFDWPIDQSKFEKMTQSILDENLNELKKFLRNNSEEWRKVGLFVCCKTSKKQLMMDLKEDIETFQVFFESSCLASNNELLRYFHSFGVSRESFQEGFLCACASGSVETFRFFESSLDPVLVNKGFLFACASGNKELVDLLILNGKSKRINKILFKNKKKKL